jgi:hypothetical protein
MVTACIVLACVIVTAGVAPRVFRKLCPQCGKHSLVFQSLTILSAGDPPSFTQYHCARCNQRFASPDRHMFIRIEDWQRGVRTAAPRATIRRE